MDEQNVRRKATESELESESEFCPTGQIFRSWSPSFSTRQFYLLAPKPWLDGRLDRPIDKVTKQETFHLEK